MTAPILSSHRYCAWGGAVLNIFFLRGTYGGSQVVHFLHRECERVERHTPRPSTAASLPDATEG